MLAVGENIQRRLMRRICLQLAETPNSGSRKVLLYAAAKAVR